MTHDEASALLGAYALDAVSEEEAALLSAHVDECPRCTAELAEHREVAGMLGNMGGDAPRDLWERIATQATRPADAPLRTPDVVVGTRAPGAPRRHRTARSRRAPWAALATVATVAAVTIVLMASQISTLNGKVDHLATVSQRQGISLSEQAALLQPSTRRVMLTSAPQTTTGVAEVVLVRSGLSYFVNDELGALPRTETYQLWGIDSKGKAVSLGLLGARPTVVPFVANLPRPPTTYAVTVERATGVVAPTAGPIAATAAQA